MNIFLFFEYGTIALFSAVFILSVWIIASNAVYVRIEKKNQITRNTIKALITNLLSQEKTKSIHLEKNKLKTLILGNKKLTSGVLAQIVSTEGEPKRSELIANLRDYGLPALEEQALKNLTSLRKHKRLWAAANLPYLAPAQVAIPALQTALTDRDYAVVLSAAQSLSTLGCSESACTIIKSLASQQIIHWTRIVELMPALGPAAIDPLTQSLASHTLTYSERAVTLASLGALKAKQAEAIIAAHLTDQNKHIRIQAAKALGNLPAKNSTPKLISALEDSVWEVRVVCANALGKIEDLAALKPLFKHLGDPVYWVRYNSAEALGHMHESGITELERGLTNDDPFVRDTCRSMLERLKNLHSNADGAPSC